MILVVNLRDSYKPYKERAENPVDSKLYLKITGGMYQFIMKKVQAGNDVELGGGQSLGTIGIRGTKGGKLKTDWKQTYILWNSNPDAKKDNVRVYHLNDHSNGITYHYYWWTAGMKIGFKRLYSFKFAKDNKRVLTRLAFEGGEWLLKSKKDYNEQQINGEDKCDS